VAEFAGEASMKTRWPGYALLAGRSGARRKGFSPTAKIHLPDLTNRALNKPLAEAARSHIRRKATGSARSGLRTPKGRGFTADRVAVGQGTGTRVGEEDGQGVDRVRGQHHRRLRCRSGRNDRSRCVRLPRRARHTRRLAGRADLALFRHPRGVHSAEPREDSRGYSQARRLLNKGGPAWRSP